MDEKIIKENFNSANNITKKSEFEAFGFRPFDQSWGWFERNPSQNDVDKYVAKMGQTGEDGTPGVGAYEATKYLQTEMNTDNSTPWNIESMTDAQYSAFKVKAADMQLSAERRSNTARMGSNQAILDMVNPDQTSRAKRMSAYMSGLPQGAILDPNNTVDTDGDDTPTPDTADTDIMPKEPEYVVNPTRDMNYDASIPNIVGQGANKLLNFNDRAIRGTKYYSDKAGQSVIDNVGPILSDIKDGVVRGFTGAPDPIAPPATDRPPSDVVPFDFNKGMNQNSVTPPGETRLFDHKSEVGPIPGNAGIKNSIANVETSTGANSLKSYDTKQNSSGYEGKYQFRYRNATDLGYSLAKQLGIDPKGAKSPKQQEAIMDLAVEKNTQGLRSRGIEPTQYNLWLAHNQGVGGTNAILSGKLTPTIRRNIKAQGVTGRTDEILIANYHKKFKSRF